MSSFERSDLGDDTVRILIVAKRELVDKSVVHEKLPDLKPITKKTRDENTQRILTGGVHINQRRYRTDDEDREFRENCLLCKLP
jgi:regulator of replication initiation timing